MVLRSRKTPRAQWYDYTSPGTYFITICTKNREHYFGEIHNEKMFLNEIGDICDDEIHQTQEKRKHITIDQYCIMPNHVHLLLIIQNNIDDNVGTRGNVSYKSYKQKDVLPYVPTESLGSIIRNIKSRVQKICNDKNISFARQSRYHDHIVKSEDEYNKIKWYIMNNPSNWKDDTFNR